MAGVLQNAKRELESMIPRVQQVMRQTRQRLFQGNTHAEEKIVSVFAPETEIIRRQLPAPGVRSGQTGGRQTPPMSVRQRPVLPFVGVHTQHHQQLGCVPKVVAADPGFFSAKNETAAADLGVRQVSVRVGPNRQRDALVV